MYDQVSILWITTPAFGKEDAVAYYIGTWNSALTAQQGAAFVPGTPGTPGTPVTTAPEPATLRRLSTSLLLVGGEYRRKAGGRV
ncbi:MAG: hypothetical protein ABJB74_23285 [Gemmatimonas sp.]